MKNLVLTAVLLAATFCTAQSIKKVDSFSKVMIEADAEIEIMNSTKNQVMFSVEDSMISNFTVESNNNSLIIKQNAGNKIDGLKIRIYTNSLSALAVKGDAKVSMDNFRFQNSMIIQASHGATVNTGTTKIANLQVIRSSDSMVLAENAQNTKESINDEIATK